MTGRAAIGATIISFLLVACGSADRQGGNTATSADGPPPRLILLVSLDTLRADRLEVYGYQRETAPNLASLAAEGTVFRTVAAQATQTLLSHKSLLTARYPQRLLVEAARGKVEGLAGTGRGKLVRTFRGVRSDLLPLLARNGLRTTAFVDGGWMRREMGFAPSFDSYDDSGGGLEEIVPRVNTWLSERQSQNQPAFVFVHAYDVHCPYVSREPYDTLFCDQHGEHLDLTGKCPKRHFSRMDLAPDDLRAISDHYDGGIASADAWMGELFAELRAAGLYDEALIVVTSDHGESLGERGDTGHGGLSLEQILVPLILKWPASWGVTPGWVEEPVELADLMPTILEIADIPVPAGLDGRSLLPLVEGGATDRTYQHTQIVFRAENQTSWPTSRALLDPGRVLAIYHPHNEQVAVFDLRRDPRALRNIAALGPPHLHADLEAVRNESMGSPSESIGGASNEALDHDLDSEAVQDLRALGYL